MLSRVSGDQRPSMRVTARDVGILRALSVTRYLTSRQVETLFFRPPGSPVAEKGRVNSRCLKRLQLLFHAGLIARDEMPQRLSEGRAPLVYWLDRKGADYLAEDQGVAAFHRSDGVSDLFISHRLAVADVYVAVCSAAPTREYALDRWQGEDELKDTHSQDKEYVDLVGPNGGRIRFPFIPDGYFRLGREQRQLSFFLELDRATTTVRAGKWNRRDMSRKYQAYMAYIESGRYEAKYGGRGVRILTVVQAGQRRLENLKRICEEAGGTWRFWFALAQDVTPEKVLDAPIWHVATEQEPRELIRRE
jgi:hypothetical protein